MKKRVPLLTRCSLLEPHQESEKNSWKASWLSPLVLQIRSLRLWDVKLFAKSHTLKDRGKSRAHLPTLLVMLLQLP